ncbi:short chain dehydrogenase [Marinicauda pacifica]|uniref:NAD(P)-dependent oxidoreductase n=1 Tax=Marinicauda pacifica TaxID=1133559 RepID=A0A4S2HDP2_9PROT|nr:NAD(P)-dependent oxidoreductase [Marinicauda pacifica]TGY93881.1 NAD(P)-dependent oxidoreductase [Marinicauda pacifica]GGE31122.1 short chain dehydrogenase [Marinicauda pacifica]
MSLKGKTIFITGASRGIGEAIALRCARDGANIVIAAKTEEPHPKLPGTIHTAAEAVEKAGGRALPIVCDIRDEENVEHAVKTAAEHFGGIDAVINNASAIFPRSTAETPIKRWDLMHQVNARGTFLVTQKCLPWLEKSENPHILALSPPLDMKQKWFAPHVAYTSAKFGMSLCILGWSGEFAGKIAANAIWPRTAIATAAVSNVLAGEEAFKNCRKPEILAETAYRVLTKPAAQFSGNFLIDDTFLASEGVTDFDQFAVEPGHELLPDFFVPDDAVAPDGVKIMDISLAG